MSVQARTQRAGERAAGLPPIARRGVGERMRVQAAEREALWALGPEQRRARGLQGRLSSYQLYTWAANRPRSARGSPGETASANK